MHSRNEDMCIDLNLNVGFGWDCCNWGLFIKIPLASPFGLYYPKALMKKQLTKKKRTNKIKGRQMCTRVYFFFTQAI